MGTRGVWKKSRGELHCLMKNLNKILIAADKYMKTFSLVAEQQNPTFETIEELLRDQRAKFSMLAGQVHWFLCLCLSQIELFTFASVHCM